jgi:hypothetical protein
MRIAKRKIAPVFTLGGRAGATKDGARRHCHVVPSLASRTLDKVAGRTASADRPPIAANLHGSGPRSLPFVQRSCDLDLNPSQGADQRAARTAESRKAVIPASALVAATPGAMASIT